MSEVLAAATLMVALLFVAAGAGKLRDVRGFAQELADYRILPRSTVPAMAVAIPVVELAAGTMAVIATGRLVAAAVMLVLLLGFTAAVARNVMAGRTDLACACFGARSRPIGWSLVGRNLAMAAALAAAILSGVPESGVPSAAAATSAALLALMLWMATEFAGMNEQLRRAAA